MSFLARVQTIVGEQTGSVLLETATVLSQPSFEVRQVICGEPQDITAEVFPGQVLLRGRLPLQIRHVGTDLVVHRQWTLIDFCQSIQMAGASPGQRAWVTITGRSVASELNLEGTLISSLIALDFCIQLTTPQTLRLEPGSGEAHLWPRIIGNLKHSCQHRELVRPDHPAGGPIELRAEAEILKTEALEQAVLIEGRIRERLHGDDSGPEPCERTSDFPFSHTLELSGAGPGMLVEAAVGQIRSSYEPAGESGRLLHTIDYELTAMVCQNVIQKITPGDIWIRSRQVVDRGQVVETIRHRCQPAWPLHELHGAEAEVVDPIWEVLADRLVGRAVVVSWIQCADEEGVERRVEQRIPVRMAAPAAGARTGMDVEVLNTVVHTSASVDPATGGLDLVAIVEMEFVVWQSVRAAVKAHRV